MSRAILPVATGRQTLRTVGTLLGRYRAATAGAVLLSVAASVAAVAAPLLLGRVVDLVAAGSGLGALLAVCGALLVAGLAAGVLTALSRAQVVAVGALVCADLREEVLDRSLSMESARLEAAGTGDVTSRVTDDVELITTSVRLAAGVFGSLVTVLVTVVGFASLDPRIALAFLAIVPVYAFALRRFLPLARVRYAAERRTAAERAQAVLSTLHGARTVQAYGLAERQGRQVEAASRSALQARLYAIRGFLPFANAMNFAEAIGLAAVLLAGFFLVRQGSGTVGDVTAAALLFHRLFGPLGMLLLTFNDIQSAGAALARLVGIADLPAVVAGEPRAIGASVELRARGLQHAYREGQPVLHGLDLDVPPGTSLAVVGESGAGKTTLAALLGGVFPATAGSVSVGDRPVGDLDPAALRATVGVVTQEVHVFTGPLADDLRLARPEATDEQLWAALRVVEADGWVSALPDGPDTRVGAGEHALTSAQAQQLALARIVLVDPPVVVLDEATAEAGSAGARLLERASAAVLAGRTAVVVAHRLTQAQACDRIAVMADGRIVELGTPDELVAAGGPYAELWAAWHR